MRRALISTAVGLAVVLSLSGCTSSGSDGQRHVSSVPTSPSPSAPVATGSATTTGTPVAPAALVAKVRRGLAGITSAHVTSSSTVSESTSSGSGTALRGSGVLVLRHGTVAQAELIQALPGGLGQVHIVATGGRIFARLPSVLHSGSRPWTRLDNSTVPILRRIGTSANGLISVATPASVLALAQDASAVRDLGTGTVEGGQVRRYLLTVPTRRLTGLPSALSVGPARTVEAELDLDPADRPALLHGSLLLDGTAVTATITLTDFDAPVHINAPPAYEVSSR